MFDLLAVSTHAIRDLVLLHYSCGTNSILLLFSSLAIANEDYCGVEPVTHPPYIPETRPPPILDDDKVKKAYRRTDSAILGGLLAVIFIALLIMAILLGRFLARHKGEYLTQEDKGAQYANDPDSAVVKGERGHQVTKRKEYFI